MEAPWDPSHFTRCLVELEVLVAQGLLEVRHRPDGRTGYWPTERGLEALRSASFRDDLRPLRDP
ncbi:MAG TPA: hypothetical protein VM241_02330 [Candidatus Thermoplasmatota archaeon]|nr:hypothetical protein [Candidatus Thermoplasmatota archaeon]